METLQEIIDNEQSKFDTSNNANDKLNILHNLVVLKNQQRIDADNYKNSKLIVAYYVDNVKNGNFGYDSINTEKLSVILGYLTLEERIFILKYAISTITRELPEYDKEWFQCALNKAEIRKIFSSNKIQLYPKALLLFSSVSFNGLLIVLLMFFIIVVVVLYPVDNPLVELFSIHCHSYANNSVLNHLLNVLTLFADIDNDFKIVVLCPFGAILLVFAKVMYVVFIVNFIYGKLSDKISLK